MTKESFDRQKPPKGPLKVSRIGFIQLLS